MKRTLPLAFGSVSIHPFTPNDIQSDPKPARETLKQIVSSHPALVIPRTKRRPAVSIRFVTYARPSGPNPQNSRDVDVTEGTRTSHLYASLTMSHASTLTRVQATSTVRTRRGSSARRGASVVRASGVYGASFVHSFARAFETRWSCVDRKPSGLLTRSRHALRGCFRSWRLTIHEPPLARSVRVVAFARATQTSR